MTLPWLLKENGNNNKENIVKKTKYTEKYEGEIWQLIKYKLPESELPHKSFDVLSWKAHTT